jgi:replicative DNA helicase
MSLNSGENGKLEPHSRDAERCLLSACLRDNAMLGDVIPLVAREDFYVDAHQKIFASMVDLYDGAKPVDLVILAEVLRDRGEVEDIGGYAYLGELWHVGAADAVHYAEVVRSKATLRALMQFSQKIYSAASNETGLADDLLQQAEREVLDIEERRLRDDTISAGDMAQEFYDRIDDRCQDKKLPGVPTGFLDVDNVTSGLQKGELVVLAARPSVGKTTLALNIAYHVFFKEKVPVLFVSLEQSHGEIFERTVCRKANFDSHQLRAGRVRKEDGDKLNEAAQELKKVPWFVSDAPGQGMLKIAAKARRHRLRNGIGLLIIDYLQLIEPEDSRANRQEQVAAISRRLKSLAKELKIPVLALAQLNRSLENRSDAKPRLSDLRESGSIEQDADVVMLMYQPEANSDLIRLDIAKQRNGPTREVSLFFRRQYMRFENFAMESPFNGGD